MKARISKLLLTAAVGVGFCMVSVAQTAATTNSTHVAMGQAISGAGTSTTALPATPVAKEASPARLPYGVEDVLKLSRSGVSDDVVLNYIDNTGTIYNLGPKDIVHLKQEGISDQVINAMLGQRKKVIAESAAQVAQQQQAATPGAIVNASAIAVANPQPAPIYVTAPVVEAQSVPAPSSVYVIPYPAARSAYYGYYRPWGYGYYGSPYSYYGAPGASFVVRIGGGGHGLRHYR